MTEPTAPRAPLTVETDLDLTIDGITADVASTGDRLFVDFDSLTAAGVALRGRPPVRIGGVAAGLAETGLTVEVRSRGRTVLAIGADARAGPLSQRLGAAPAELRLGGLIGALGEEISAAVRRVRTLLE